MPEPRLITTSKPRRPVGVALVLHGGASRPGRMEVSPAQLSVLRMVPIARRIARSGRGRVAVHRLLNTHRGWATTHTPVDDVAWALHRLRSAYGEVPVGLVGHSLGGRAALLAGGQDGVVGVAALNAWVYPTDRPGLAGRRVLFVHGTDDRVASIERARTVARSIRGAEVDFVEVPGGKHAMLAHGPEFERLAADHTLRALAAAS